MKTSLKNIITSILFAGIFIFASTAFAALELELTQGVSSAVPIAVLPINAVGNAAVKSDELMRVVKADLQNSGRFQMLDVSAPSVDYDYLREQKVDNAMTGTAETAGSNSYKFTIQLHDVFKKNILLDKIYSASDYQLRKLSHHISDEIFEQLTGIRGIFSTRIAYILVARIPGKPINYSLIVADADGYNPRVLMTSKQPIMSPSWSPDGKRIAYVSFENNRAAIFSQDISSGARQVITRLPGINGAPAWAPDGSKMAVVLTLSGDPKIYLLDVATKKLRQLTSGWSLDTEPSFSPDGASLIFTSSRGGGPQIYKVDLASGNINRVTFQGNYNARASFTPDGKNITMLHQERGMFNIAVQNLETGRLSIITQTGNDESPSIAPNGNMIVYATKYGNKGVLSLVSIDGRIKLRLPAREGDVQEPAWGPFGKV